MSEELLRQIQADLDEAEASEWAVVLPKFRAIPDVPSEWEEIAESAFKAGLRCGAVWGAKYLKERIP